MRSHGKSPHHLLVQFVLRYNNVGAVLDSGRAVTTMQAPDTLYHHLLLYRCGEIGVGPTLHALSKLSWPFRFHWQARGTWIRCVYE